MPIAAASTHTAGHPSDGTGEGPDGEMICWVVTNAASPLLNPFPLAALAVA